LNNLTKHHSDILYELERTGYRGRSEFGCVQDVERDFQSQDAPQQRKKAIPLAQYGP
jgi:hypothetical protein